MKTFVGYFEAFINVPDYEIEDVKQELEDKGVEPEDMEAELEGRIMTIAEESWEQYSYDLELIEIEPYTGG